MMMTTAKMTTASCSRSSSSSSSSSLFTIGSVLPLRLQQRHRLVSSVVRCSASSSSYGGRPQDPQGRGNAGRFRHQRTPGSGYGDDGREASSSSSTSAVSVFWDLDNKPPKTSAYEAAMALKGAASRFGHVVEMMAYANKNAFLHIPEWVRRERRERKELDIVEQKMRAMAGKRSSSSSQEKPYVCGLCGRRCQTNVLLKKHFKQLHEREQQKRMARLGSLKGKKRAKFRDAVRPKTERYHEAARPILVPKHGFRLEADLRRAGVYVRTVQFRPQAADIALTQSMEESMSSGRSRCLCLVSDDAGFTHVLSRARSQFGLTVIVLGDGSASSLRRHADFWFPWDDISRGIALPGFDDAVNWHCSRLVGPRGPSASASASAFASGSASGSPSVTLGHDLLDEFRRHDDDDYDFDDDDAEHRLFMWHDDPPRVITPRLSAFSDDEPPLDGDDENNASGHDTWLYDDDDDDDDDDGGGEAEGEDEDEDFDADDGDWDAEGIVHREHASFDTQWQRRRC